MSRSLVALALATVAFALAGCGGGENTKALPDTVVGSVPTQQQTESTPVKEGDAAAGKKIFQSAGCTSCHTLKDAGSTGTVGPNLDDAKPTLALATQRVTNGAGAMPSFKGQLSGEQIADVATYVVKATGG